MDSTTPSFFDVLINNASAYISAYTSSQINALVPQPSSPTLSATAKTVSMPFFNTTGGKLILAATGIAVIVWAIKK